MASFLFLLFCILLAVLLFVKTDKSLSSSTHYLTTSQNRASRIKMNSWVFIFTLLLLCIGSFVFLTWGIASSISNVEGNSSISEKDFGINHLHFLVDLFLVGMAQLYFMFWLFVALLIVFTTLLYLVDLPEKIQAIIKAILYATLAWPLLYITTMVFLQ